MTDGAGGHGSLSDWKPPRLRREELYELVWAEPVIKVAADFGVSNVAIRKWCVKLDVPVPGRGALDDNGVLVAIAETVEACVAQVRRPMRLLIVAREGRKVALASCRHQPPG